MAAGDDFGDHAEEHVLSPAQAFGDGVRPFDLFEMIAHQETDPGADGVLQFGVRLVVAVQRHVRRGYAGAQRCVELATRRGKHPESFASDQLKQSPGRQGLHGIHGSGERLAEVTTPPAQMLLVDHEQGGAVTVGKRCDGDATDLEAPLTPMSGDGPGCGQRRRK